jgi:hypothetical protein
MSLWTDERVILALALDSVEEADTEGGGATGVLGIEVCFAPALTGVLVVIPGGADEVVPEVVPEVVLFACVEEELEPTLDFESLLAVLVLTNEDTLASLLPVPPLLVTLPALPFPTVAAALVAVAAAAAIRSAPEDFLLRG